MKKEVSLKHKAIVVGIFSVILIVGLFLPLVVDSLNSWAIEVIMAVAAFVIGAYIIVFTDRTWDDIISSVTKSVANAIPALLILLVIGVLIGGFIMSGLMPMIVYFGIKLINPTFIYAISFILAALFSIFTGASWGAAATIGVAMMGIGTAVGAELPIMAGAIVGGSYFGDKMSPLSDTTNVAAIAAEISVYDHVASMMWTTIPASLIALAVYTACGFIYPATMTDITDPSIITLLTDLEGMFNFSILLFVPLLVVLIGSAMKKPVLPVMAMGAFLSMLIAFFYQGFNYNDIISGLYSGFSVSMVTWYDVTPAIDGQTYIVGTFERGGLWSLGSLIPILIAILSAVGVMDTINAIPGVVNAVFANVKRRATIIISSLVTGIVTIAMTSNGSACCFVTSSIFKEKYDENNISRKVLSRTTEDSGTMLDALLPWTPAGIFMASTLGVATTEYAVWAIANWCTPVVAVFLAVTGIGTFKNEIQKQKEIIKEVNASVK